MKRTLISGRSEGYQDTPSRRYFMYLIIFTTNGDAPFVDEVSHQHISQQPRVKTLSHSLPKLSHCVSSPGAGNIICSLIIVELGIVLLSLLQVQCVN